MVASKRNHANHRLPTGELTASTWSHYAGSGTLRWFIDSFGTIADWRDTLLRIATFRETLLTMDALGAALRESNSLRRRGATSRLRTSRWPRPPGAPMLSEQHVEIAPGDRVLIVGEPGAGKTLPFQAIAGLWPWGSGKVALPASNGVTFVPRQPYVPLGTARCACLSLAREHVVLRQAGLERLISAGLKPNITISSGSCIW